MKKEEYEISKRIESIEICGRCGGHGVVEVSQESWSTEDPEFKTCPLCEGSGRLNKVVTVNTWISPFKGN